MLNRALKWSSSLLPPCTARAGDYEQRSMGLIRQGGTYISVFAKWTAWGMALG